MNLTLQHSLNWPRVVGEVLPLHLPWEHVEGRVFLNRAGVVSQTPSGIHIGWSVFLDPICFTTSHGGTPGILFETSLMRTSLGHSCTRTPEPPLTLHLWRYMCRSRLPLEFACMAALPPVKGPVARHLPGVSHVKLPLKRCCATGGRSSLHLRVPSYTVQLCSREPFLFGANPLTTALNLRKHILVTLIGFVTTCCIR